MVRKALVGLVWPALVLTLAGVLAPGAAAALWSRPDAREEGGGASSPPLTPDPELVVGTLENGLTYAIKRHAGARGQINLQLVVRAGSLAESDEQRGAASVLANLLAASATPCPDKEAALPAERRRPQALVESRADFERTTFTLTLSGGEDSLASALRSMGRVAQGEGLNEEALLWLRPSMLKRERSGAALSQRLSRAVLPQLAPGSRLVDRQSPVCEETLCRLELPHLAAFHREWYRAGNMVLVVVGDVPERRAAQAIAQSLGDLPVGSTRVAGGAIAPLPPGPRAIVVTDAELDHAAAEIVSIDAPDGPVRSEADMRRSLAIDLAMRALARRLKARSEPGEGAFRDAETWAGDAPGPMRLAVAGASADEQEWAALVRWLCASVTQAAVGGISARELAEVRETLLSDAEREAANPTCSGPAGIACCYADSLARGSTPLSPAQRYALAVRLAPSIGEATVSDALADLFDPLRSAVVLMAPRREGTPAPDPDEVRRIAEEAFAQSPEPTEDGAAPPTLMARLPEPGPVAEITLHPASAVTSVWLGSGVRVHHKRSAAAPGQVWIVINLVGGRIEEPASGAVLTDALAALWESPASKSRSGGAVRRVLASQPVDLRSAALDDRVELVFSCRREHLETAGQLAHLLLAEPRVEPAALKRWQWAALRQARAGNEQAEAAAMSLLAASVFPCDDRRHFAPRIAEIESIEEAIVQAWAEELTSRAPIEAAIVGDVDRGEAIALAARYLGSLPPRGRVSVDSHCDLRHLPALAPARPMSETCGEASSQAVVLIGRRTGAQPADESALVLDLAAEALALRLAEKCVRERSLASSVSVRHEPAEAFPGRGAIYASMTCEPVAADLLCEAAERVFESLAREGPTPAELAAARARAAAALDQRDADPAACARLLAASTLRGVRLDALVDERSLLAGITARRIAETLAASGAEGNRLQIVVRPKPDETASR